MSIQLLSNLTCGDSKYVDKLIKEFHILNKITRLLKVDSSNILIIQYIS